MPTPELDVLIIGGGPAGSTAAAVAAKAGLKVRVLEADQHPRTHVGESLLPGIIPILAEIGALADVEAHGFNPKTGTTHWQWGTTPDWDLWFSDTDTYDHAWLVERAKFDAILIEAAKRAGAEVLEHTLARELLWEGDRLVGVRHRERGSEEDAFSYARFVIDASGQAALIARNLKTRNVIDGLRHQASWAHYENAGTLPPPRQNQALFVAERKHWLWLFPFGGGKASVGVVRLDDGEGKEAQRTEAFDQTVARSEAFSKVIGPSAKRVTPVRTQRDWSYRVSSVTGPGWLMAGDSSGFIDPVLSTGVFLAMHAGRHAARTIADIIDGTQTEADALASYGRHHRELFGDLLRMVRFYYQQNLSQDDYFWESKRILMRPDTELKPQKAFLILTSGLVRNLAFESREEATRARRERALTASAPDVDDSGLLLPEKLGFVCFQIAFDDGGERPAQLYLLIEPKDQSAPSLFRTPSFDVNCLAPRYDNDAISQPAIEPHLRELGRAIRAQDTVAGESLAAFWKRSGAAVVSAVRGLPEQFQLIRVFGE